MSTARSIHGWKKKALKLIPCLMLFFYLSNKLLCLCFFCLLLCLTVVLARLVGPWSAMVHLGDACFPPLNAVPGHLCSSVILSPF
jgi:hypothetical protein